MTEGGQGAGESAHKLKTQRRQRGEQGVLCCVGFGLIATDSSMEYRRLM